MPQWAHWDAWTGTMRVGVRTRRWRPGCPPTCPPGLRPVGDFGGGRLNRLSLDGGFEEFDESSFSRASSFASRSSSAHIVAARAAIVATCAPSWSVIGCSGPSGVPTGGHSQLGSRSGHPLVSCVAEVTRLSKPPSSARTTRSTERSSMDETGSDSWAEGPNRPGSHERGRPTRTTLLAVNAPSLTTLPS